MSESSRLWGLVQSGISRGDDQSVLDTINALLETHTSDQSPQDIQLAQQCKLVALTRLGQFQQALDTIQQHDSFQNAYLHYKLKHNEQALKALKQLDTDNIPAKHLQALLNYRMDNFKEAAAIYATDLADPNSEDWTTNYIACLVADGRPEEAIKVGQKFASSATSSYDFLFNYSCALVDHGDLKEAHAELDSAFKRGLEKLQSENYESEEIDKELQPISVMRAYTLQLLGQTEEALHRYSAILKSEKGDEAAIATAANNMISLRVGEEKVFESMKRMTRASKVPEDQLSAQLRKALKFNQALLAFYSKQNQRCQNLCKDLTNRFPGDEFPHLVLAALYFREKQFAKCEAELAQTTSDVGILTKALVLIRTNKLKNAIEVLQSLEQLRYEPAVMSVITKLFDRVNDIQAAVKYFDVAIAHHQNVTKDFKKTQLLRMKSASFKFRKGFFQECIKEFETLVADGDKSGKIPLDVLSSMVVAASRVGSNIAAKYADQLPPLPGMANVNIDDLEAHITTPLELIKKREKTRDDEEGADSDASKVKSKAQKKRKRKKRFPKNFDPVNPGPLPDPERWLPRWQRSSKKKMSKKMRDSLVFKGAQGSVDNTTPEHSRKSSGATSPTAADNQARSEPKSSSSAAPKRGNQKKKGGKGRR